MLDQKDLEAIAALVDARATQTEKLLLDELDRTQNNLEKNIAEVQKNIDELKQFYRIQKLEDDNTSLLLKIVTELQARVSELENKIA